MCCGWLVYQDLVGQKVGADACRTIWEVILVCVERAPVIYGGGQIATSWRAPANGNMSPKGKIKTVVGLGGLIRNKGGKV